jgi:hypothetical protein
MLLWQLFCQLEDPLDALEIGASALLSPRLAPHTCTDVSSPDEGMVSMKYLSRLKIRI